MFLALKLKLSPSKSITWKDRFEDTVSQAQALLNEKKPFFIEKGLDEIKISSLIPQEQLTTLIKASVGSTISYIEKDYYAETDEAKRALFAAPPFEGPELNALVESLKNKTQEDKLKAYTQFYLDQFSKQPATAIIQQSYGYNPGLVIKIKDKLVKKPGGLRNQMANDIVARLIKIDARFGARKQFEYVNNSVQSTLASVEAQILQSQENEGTQEDFDAIYQSNIDTMDLRMLHFLSTPEQNSLWLLCVALDKVAEIMNADPSTQDLADLVYTFVDQHLTIRPSSFQEQRAQLIILINKIKNKRGLDADHQYSALIPLETLLKEKIKIPAEEEALKALFILSKLRAVLVEYHAVKIAQKQAASSESSSGFVTAATKNMEKLRDKMPFIESAIQWIDDRSDQLRAGKITGKRFLEIPLARLSRLAEINNVHHFLHHCAESLNITSRLGDRLFMMLDEANRQWRLTNVLIKYSSWATIQTIEIIVAKAMHDRTPIISEDLTLLQTLSNAVKGVGDLSKFMRIAQSTLLFKHYESLMHDALLAFDSATRSPGLRTDAEAYSYGIMVLMIDALKQMIAFSRLGISQRPVRDELLDSVAELHSEVLQRSKQGTCATYNVFQHELASIGHSLGGNSVGIQTALPDYYKDFLPLDERLNVFKPNTMKKHKI